MNGTDGIRTFFFCRSYTLPWGAYVLNPGTVQQVEESTDPTGQSKYHQWSKYSVSGPIHLVWDFEG